MVRVDDSHQLGAQAELAMKGNGVMTKPSEKLQEAANQPPVDKIRIGMISASIWERSTEKGQFYSVSFERRYKDAAGQYQTAHNYDTRDLLTLAKVADLAHTRIMELSDQRNDGDSE
jgi:hypothetical protein